jgi:diguanylate cyclase (GGDEF)-like protein/PAS domain S-box-containing protein
VLRSSQAGPERPHDAVDPAALQRLAQRWVQAAPGIVAARPAPAGVVHRLATILRRLASVLRTEPFEPSGAQELGGAVVESGLCGRPPVADVLAATLRLLRADAPAALGVPGVDGARRTTVALDHLAAGFAEALADAGRMAPPPAGPAAVAGAATADAASNRPASAGRPDAAPAGSADAAGVAATGWAGVDLRLTMADDAPVGVAVMTLDGRVLTANPELTAFLELGDLLAEPRPFTDFVHADDLPEALERYARLLRGEPDTQRMDLRVVRPDGVILWVRIVARLVRTPDGAPSHIVIVLQDDPDRLWSPAGSVRERLSRLPGESVTEDWLRRAFAGGITRVGICALDLDGFGALVDAHGADVGDRLLLAVAGRLRLAAGQHLTTRTGGDEFTVLVADPEDITAVCRVADRLLGALAVPFPIDGLELVVSASLGVAEGPTVHGCPLELRRAADVARSWAKALGGGRRVMFDPRRDAGEAARYALVAGLPRGIANGEFRLVYQPLVTLPEGRVRGAEALVRWQHPQEGLIGPGRFIGLAEQSGAIVELGRWVLDTACAQAARWWRELGEDAPFVSVNVSPVQLREPSWVTDVIATLRAEGLPPRQLQLEITEQAVLGDGTAVTEGLSALRAAGVRLALDDFGTGWSSLAWLRRLPVHALKIDGSFIDGLRHADADTADSAIVRALVGMAHALGLEVTAEWVETGVQADRLAALTCDLGQGRWFGDAGPGEWVPEMVRRTMRP